MQMQMLRTERLRWKIRHFELGLSGSDKGS